MPTRAGGWFNEASMNVALDEERRNATVRQKGSDAVSDDFFDKVDAKLSSDAAKKQAANDLNARNREFSKKAISEVYPLAVEYKKKLVERGIHVELNGSETGFSFKAFYADGGHNGLEVYPTLETGEIQFHSIYTNDDGRNHRGTDAARYNEKNWTPKEFEVRLKKSIDDFLFYADRHGGAVTERR